VKRKRVMSKLSINQKGRRRGKEKRSTGRRMKALPCTRVDGLRRMLVVEIL